MSHFIIANLLNTAYNSFCSLLRWDHFLLGPFLLLGFSFTAGNCSWHPQACLFQSTLWLLAPFSIFWLLVFPLRVLPDSLIQPPPGFHVPLFVPFCLAFLQYPHHAPQAFPISHAWVKLIFPPRCLISVNEVTQCPCRDLRNHFDSLFPLLPTSVNHQDLMGAPHNFISSQSTPLLPYLTPLSLIQTIKTTYQYVPCIKIPPLSLVLPQKTTYDYS